MSGSGVCHGVDYDNEVTDGEYEHLALVEDPRYEDSIILTPDEFKAYNLEKENELSMLTNSKSKNIIKKGLRLFTENQILQFEESKNIPIYFVGSIAHFLNDEIKEVLEEYNLKLGKIIRHPINTLAEHHASNF